jgi:hypothetical protein
MRKVIAIAGIASLSLVWAAVPAGAGNLASFDINPTSGPPGTVIHASDHNFGCDSIDANIHVELINNDETVVASADTTVTNQSIWDVDITVPADAAPGDYIVTARCNAEGSFFYNEDPFTVTAPPATTTTTSTTVAAAAVTTTTTTVPAAVVVPAATPAAPVVAAPTMTG